MHFLQNDPVADNQSGYDGLISDVDSINLRLFIKLDGIIEQEKLFTRHDLSREVLCDVISVGRNRFTTIMRQYSGATNLSEYINRKRVNYAVQLMKQYPQWTLEAICDACGMNNTSFKRYFKMFHGMPPSEYRASKAWNSLNDDNIA